VVLLGSTSKEEAPAQPALASAGGAHALRREAGTGNGQRTTPVEPGYAEQAELGGEGRDVEPVASAGDQQPGHLLDPDGRLDEAQEDRTLERVGDGAGARR